MYHYVRDLQNSQYPKIKGLETKLFQGQIEYLLNNYNVISMEQAIDFYYNNSKLPPKPALLTFDDGYSDHYETVLPILLKNNLKGSFYIPAKTVLENKVLDVNKIHFILASQFNKQKIIYDLKNIFEKYSRELNLMSFDYYYNKLAIEGRFDNAEIIFIKRFLQVELPESLRLKITDELFQEYIGMSEYDFSKKLYMNLDQISEMKSVGMHIGCHGYDHYWWNKLSDEQLSKEVSLSIDFLSRIGVNRDAWTTAYPYGSYSEYADKILRDNGCKLAFTTEVGLAEIDNSTKMKLKRLDTNDIPQQITHKTDKWFLEATN
jgi:peptidoglycan/xylan/chitin deacetylase (PgdA/CDA1 family)